MIIELVGRWVGWLVVGETVVGGFDKTHFKRGSQIVIELMKEIDARVFFQKVASAERFCS